MEMYVKAKFSEITATSPADQATINSASRRSQDLHGSGVA
jgi:hypothetical protein